MKVIFDGIILEDRDLRKVEVVGSEASSDKFDVIATDGNNRTILKTVNTEDEGKVWVNGLSDKLSSEEDIATLDAR